MTEQARTSATYAPLGIGIALLVVLVLVLLLVGGLGAKSPPNENREPATDGRGDISIGVSWSPPFEKFDTCVIKPFEPGAELPNCYREPVVQDSFVKQPWSVIAAVALSLSGLGVLLWAARQGPTTRPFGFFFKVWFGFVALMMGPGSMVFHASLSEIGGWLDQVSMFMLLAFMLTYTLLRLFRIQSYSEVFFSICYTALLILFSSIAYAVIGPDSLRVFIVIAAIVAAGDIAFAIAVFAGYGPIARSWQRYLLAFGALGFSFIPWFFSNPDIARAGPTDFPFHAVWHLTSAGFVFAYFWYLESEVLRAPATRSN